MKLWNTIGAVVAAAVAVGCSVHSQAPIKQVAYDFSDHAYYDHPHASSPDYRDDEHGYPYQIPDDGASAPATGDGRVASSATANAGPGTQFFHDPVSHLDARPSVPTTQVSASSGGALASHLPAAAPPPEVTLPSPRGAGPEIQVYNARVFPTIHLLVGGVGGLGGYGYGHKVDVVKHTEKHTSVIEHHEHHAAHVPAF